MYTIHSGRRASVTLPSMMHLPPQRDPYRRAAKGDRCLGAITIQGTLALPPGRTLRPYFKCGPAIVQRMQEQYRRTEPNESSEPPHNTEAPQVESFTTGRTGPLVRATNATTNLVRGSSRPSITPTGTRAQADSISNNNQTRANPGREEEEVADAPALGSLRHPTA